MNNLLRQTRRTLGAALIGAALLPGPIPLHAEAPASLRERQARILKVAADVAPAVVAIVPDAEAAREKGVEPGLGAGSGVIISEDGLILTAAHVLQAVGEEFAVILHDGDRVKARALGKAYGRDAALGQITEPGKYPFVPRAEPDGLAVGDWALAMGHPGGYEVDRSAPLRLGRILDTDTDGFIVTDCTLSGGDSGGPLFNLDGKVIGIHSSIGMRAAENRHVPMDAFVKNWDRLMKGDEWGRLGMREREPRNRPNRPRPQNSEPTPEPADAPAPDQPMLGVTILPGVSDQEGALVGQVEVDSPAQKAGVEAGDLIVKVNDNGIADGDALVSQITRCKPGDEVALTVKRAADTLEFKVKLVAAKELKLQ